MKAKYVMAVIGVAIIGSVCVYCYLKKGAKATDNNAVLKAEEYKTAPEKISGAHALAKVRTEGNTTENCKEAAETLKEEKATAAVNIERRHEEAAAVMHESLEHIFNESEVRETENTGTLNQMMGDLDNLMG